jgi:hypothetical protein
MVHKTANLAVLTLSISLGVQACDGPTNSRTEGAPPAGDNGRPSNAGADPDCEEVLTEVRLDEPTSFGPTANQIASHFHEVPPGAFNWGADAIAFDAFRVEKPSGTTRLVSQLERLTRAYFVHRTYKRSDRFTGRPPVNCPDRLHLEGTLRFATDDRGFDEYWPVTLKVEISPTGEPVAAYDIELDTTPVAGSFRLTWLPVEEGAQTRTFIAAGLPSSGQLTAFKWPGPSRNSGFSMPLVSWGNQSQVVTVDAGPPC